LLGRVRCPRSPASLLLWGPPTSRLLRPPLRSSLAARPTSGRALLLSRPQVHPRPTARRRFLVRLPVGLNHPRKGETLPGCWVVLWIRAAVCDPAKRAPASPLAAAALLPSGGTTPWALGNRKFRGCTHAARVLVRLRIIRGHRCPRSKAHYRPAGLGSCRAGRSPLDDSSEFHESPHDSFLSDQPCLVAPSPSPSPRRFARHRRRPVCRFDPAGASGHMGDILDRAHG
jgi:hypothetical protein